MKHPEQVQKEIVDRAKPAKPWPKTKITIFVWRRDRQFGPRYVAWTRDEARKKIADIFAADFDNVFESATFKEEIVL